ncbi:MAG: LD-carboxypeptidase [Deltaproteobacteria bacterium]|nr:LD-carboxypeptidase [Deltaproteobacteria bacterium]
MASGIIIPRRLRRGEAIGIVAPAGPVAPFELDPSIELLESLGHPIIPAPHIYQKQDYLAGEDHLRLEDLHDMFLNEQVKAVICVRGGYGTMRLLNHIDFDLIREHPKIIVGYSDITALLLGLYQKTGLITFHGPVIRDMAKKDRKNVEILMRIIRTGEQPEFDLRKATVLKSGTATGNIIGGNLSLICHLVGTPYLPSMKGALLFVEDCGEPIYRIDRMLSHLRLAGLLTEISGLIGGHFQDCGDQKAIDQLLVEVVSDEDIPVVSGISIGHGNVNIAFPIGCKAALDTEGKGLTLMGPYVRD